MISLIILQVSVWGGLMSGFKNLVSAYNRNGSVLKSPLQPGRFERRSGELVGALEGGLGGPGAPLAHVGLVLARGLASLPPRDFSFSRDLAF